jgi:signal transduction histidine kinase/ligand-binding sensor domain-containing protein/CheY-like chemotaxis protein
MRFNNILLIAVLGLSLSAKMFAQKQSVPEKIFLKDCPKPQVIIIPKTGEYKRSYSMKTDMGSAIINVEPPALYQLPIVNKKINGDDAESQITAGIGFFTTYTTDNGLALDAVFCSLRDQFGNLWFGTSGGGVSRYDGKSFTNYTTAQGLANNAIFSIFEDSKGNIWFGSHGGGVSRYDGKSFTTFSTSQGLAYNYVNCIIEDLKGNIWFGTDGGGISCYDSRSFKNFTTANGLAHNNIRSCIIDKKGNLWFGTGGAGVSIFDGKSFKNISTPEWQANNAVFSIIIDKKGIFWFGTYGKGVSCFDGSTYTNFTTSQGLASNYVRCIFEDKNGNLWFGTAGGGLSCFDGKSFINYSTAQGLTNNNVRTIIDDKNGNLWFGTGGGGISRFDGRSFINYTTAHGLKNNYVRSIFQDTKGKYWIGTWGGGVSCYDGKSFCNYTIAQGLPNNYVNSIHEDKNGFIWFGTDGGGASRYDGKSFTNFTSTQGLLSNNILSILEDKNDNLWFGTNCGVSKYDGISFTNYTIKQGLTFGDVFSIAEDKFGNLWFGTNGGGLSYFNGNAFINFTRSQGLADDFIYSISFDKRGNLWIGTIGGGISYISEKDLEFFQEKVDKGYKNPEIVFNNITSKSGLPSDVIKGIIEDDHGNIIIGSNQGLTVLSRSPTKKDGIILFPGSDESWLIKYYNSNTGYPVKDINGGCNNNGALFCDNNGIIWAGTGSDKTALVRFDPNAIVSSIEPPTVIIQSIKINNEEICWYNLYPMKKKEDSLAFLNEEISIYGHQRSKKESDQMRMKYKHITFSGIRRYYAIPENLVLPYKFNNITFEFAAIEPARPFMIKYQYILEGYDEEWSPVTNKKSATYGNIREGEYTFKLRACSPDGIWSEPVTYSFKVLPPWHRTWWMYTFYVLAFLVISWIINKRRELKHSKEKYVLEDKVNFRTAQLQQANEEIRKNITEIEKSAQIKQQFLANMSHEIRTPMNVIMGMLGMLNNTRLTGMQTDYVQTIQGASESLLNIINDILDLAKIEAGKMELKPTTIDVVETARKIKKLFEETARIKNIDFTVNISDNICRYVKTDENRLIQIASNLVSNAFKFTRHGKIKVDFSVKSRTDDRIIFLVEVADTGIGIDDKDKDRLFAKFSQLDNTLTRSHEGTGLGLAISKELAELMGGEIGFQSELNVGSTFWFTFAAVPSAESELVRVKSFSHFNKEMQFHLDVLLVEDKIVNQKVETLILENIGCKVEVANNGKEAVDMISQGNKYDMVFMDIQMPVMDGVQAVQILRASFTDLPPIIGLSANALEGDAERYISLGMDDYISKPFTTDQIKEKLYKWSHYSKNGNN